MTGDAAQERMTNPNGPANVALQNYLSERINPLAMIAWHGSPHLFKKFDSSKIGTGEGAQAYGHGLYLAESPEVAGQYQQKLSGILGNKRNTVFLDGAPVEFADDSARRAWEIVARDGVKNAAATSKRLKAEAFDTSVLDSVIKQSKGRTVTIAKDTGALYKVDLPDDQIAKMLDWDKPLSQQPEAVRQALQGKQAQDSIAKLKAAGQLGDYSPAQMQQLRGEDWYDMLRQAAGDSNAAPSSFLRQQGIPGIRYLDGGSRGVGQGTSNFVVFPGNEDMLKILEINGKSLLNP
jgi:hypothetical protein